MSDYQQRIAGSFQERKRLNQLRKRKENLRFWSEFRIIPRWLIVLVIVLFFAAQVIAFVVNTKVLAPNGEIFPPELKNDVALASLALAGIVTGVSLVIATMLFAIAYVNRDAKRRGMNSALWTILVIILLPAWGFIGKQDDHQNGPEGGIHPAPFRNASTRSGNWTSSAPTAEMI